MKTLVTTVLLASAVALAAPAARAGDWEGPYVGAYGAWVNGTNWGAGAQAGYNFALGGGAYAGAEADVIRVFGSGVTVGSASARLGYEFAPGVLGYGQLGLAVNNSGTTAWLAGAGGQVAISGPVSLRVGVDRFQAFGGGAAEYVVKGGLVYGF